MTSEKNHRELILYLSYMMSRASRTEQETRQRCIYEYTTNLQIVQGLRTPQTVDQTEMVVQAQWYSPKIMNARKQDNTYTKPTKLGGFTH